METINYQNFRIDAENICVDYNGKVALYDANLRLKPGQICGLVGMNGAGKTTFFNARNAGKTRYFSPHWDTPSMDSYRLLSL